MVSDAAATKAPIAKVADKVSGIFVPAVITIAVLTTIVWLIAGESVGFALARGISVLVISCHAHWDLPHQLLLWWEMVWELRMVFSLRQLFHWKKLEK